MALALSTNGASALVSATPTPLAHLSPSLDRLKERHIRAVVILLWPYSSYTKQFSLLISEPDFRLRDRKGQVRVSFHGASAEAVAKSQVSIGDTVVLSLDGARWQNQDADISTPGKSIDWDLSFSKRLLLEVYRDSELLTTVKVEPPQVERLCIDGTVPTTPNRLSSAPQAQRNGEHAGLVTDNWASPAFSQKFSGSFGSLSSLAFNPLEEEDGYIWGRGRKRTKFSRPSSEWTFVDTPPSPPPAAADAWEDEDLELDDGEQEDVTLEEYPSQGDTVPNSQTTVHADSKSQDNGRLLETQTIDNFTPPTALNISSTFSTTFDHSLPDGSAHIFTQNSNWDTTHSQQPTVTPFTSFGNSFVQDQPIVDHEATAKPPPLTLSPLTSATSSPEILEGTSHEATPSSSPISTQLHVHDTTASQLVTTQHGIAGQTSEEVGSQDEAMVNGPEGVHHLLDHRADNNARPSPPTPVVDLDSQGSFDQEATEPDHVARVTSVEEREADLTELEEAERQAALAMSQGLSGQGYDVDQEMTDQDGEGEEEIEEYVEGTAREPLEEGREELMEEKFEKIFEQRVSRKPTEDLEEELVELQEELEERMEEERLGEGEHEEGEEEGEDIEIYSDDEIGHSVSENSSELESEEEYDEGSELESELGPDEDTLPPRPTYLAVPRAPPEIIVLDSDDDEGAPVVTFAPQHVEIPSSDVPRQPSDTELSNSPPQDLTTISFKPHGEFGADTRQETGESTAVTNLLGGDIVPPNLEPSASFDETPQQETIGYMAQAALHIEAEPAATDHEGEDTSEKSGDLNGFRHASPSFSSGSMSDRELEAKLHLSDNIAIDPQLYQPKKQKSPSTRPKTPGSVDHGPSHEGAFDINGWKERRVSLSPDAKDPSETRIETPKSADIPSSPPSLEARLAEDELVTSQLFRDMEEQSRRENLQTPEFVDEQPLPIPQPPKNEEAENASVDVAVKADIDMRKGKSVDHADAIKTAELESPTVLQPNTNARGLRSRLSYFFPLSTLADNFNKMTDTISVVISCSKISRSRKGPREYHTTLHITEPSMSGITVCAQMFRKTKSSLPTAEKGDVILLRDFKVQSMDHKMMLISMTTSSWAVFPGGNDTDVQMNGPPVEFGIEEQEYVASLRQWYEEEGEQLAKKHEYLALARGSTETSSSISTSTSGSPSSSRGNIFKKYARPKRSRHRQITIHELRDGRRYAEVGVSADKETIHELRDGTVYANLS
ncbi:hypothetical protein, variant 2 [Blastomyces gilchristii SLH14081]|uniref:Telomeric single stranded DNA binding POT1/Cdc13 domain-containing protein n=1 Tax=Blastomyces gilchristii (strain SLH14081) TaxID=559298 RepID=A0A179UAZ9_BLAGS|nr:uncharacterized protein BDBG_01378 [Blastomyces gilchristii SLH14081]XP_031576423.1 hypothetical protein, variant 1 [Blastomyces gilchristii SLH14081]XP_031576424.1 hypothetical protein, variant 2 [Blastomyces gilchristii SLH14081]OAT04893.1 hypothetical protein BDBG_01378 [Blastomyces gilchristii SLH14081]OAT04894.1 hypothetical protein, variant 1 [Blastomyces gilchristii SLH14081]OAT04895.1 hypothetical protein, variant 2 [Blastomyces gilchristii SLH14081]